MWTKSSPRDARDCTGLALTWAETNSFTADQFPLDHLLKVKGDSCISVVIPALDVADTVGRVVSEVGKLWQAGLVDEISVVDGSSDGSTAKAAHHAGAEVYPEAELMPTFGPVLGKGDAMWRGASVASGDIVVFIDADTRDFSEHFVRGLVGPLLTEPSIQFVKGSFRRPFTSGDVSLPEGGGRVNELLARPALNLLFPELSAVAQPLSGEVAARSDLVAQLPFATGFAVEVQMLIDTLRIAGLDAIAQTDLGTRQNDHKPLADLMPMAYDILRKIHHRAGGKLSDSALRAASDCLVKSVDSQTDGGEPTAPSFEQTQIEEIERPPLAKIDQLQTQAVGSSPILWGGLGVAGGHCGPLDGGIC